MRILFKRSPEMVKKEWIAEIVPAGDVDKYVQTVGVHFRIYTQDHIYSITVIESPDGGYLGCIASTRKPRAGEDWTRGNDLPDGKLNYETWCKIKDAILRYELVPLDIHQSRTEEKTTAELPTVGESAQDGIEADEKEPVVKDCIPLGPPFCPYYRMPTDDCELSGGFCPCLSFPRIATDKDQIEGRWLDNYWDCETFKKRVKC